MTPNQEADADLIKRFGPDVLVVAAGSEVQRPDIPGIDLSHVKLATEALMNQKTIKEPILIADGGLVGCEVAVYFGSEGKKVTLVEMLSEVAFDLDAVSRLELLEMLKENNISILKETHVVDIKKEQLKVRRNGAERSIDAKTFIIAMSMRPRREIFGEFAHLAPASIAVGDCATPGKIGDAIHDGANKTLNLSTVSQW
ncbi:MAG: FAD-dependent oxidoreductase [Proteobacteria bacterium]|nr:FAD-dependent oxidoreductase [Pseudomonadota bacterium]